MPATHFSKVLTPTCINAIMDYPHRVTKYVSIEEDKPDATLKLLDITDMQDGDVCFTFDIGGGEDAQYSSCLQISSPTNKLTYNKRCDFIIVRINGGNAYVYFGELKSTAPRKGNIFKQLSASKLFFDYILSILRHEFDFKGILDYTPRYVCCHDADGPSPKTILRKNSTQVRNRAPEDNVKFYPIKVNQQGKGQISFNQL